MSTLLNNIICVGAGSCIGGIARYLISYAVQSTAASRFPWGTLIVNLIGCLLIGLIFGLIDRGVQMSQSVRLLLTVGFCGGFTTFSTFVHENSMLLGGTSGLLMCVLYASVSFGGGLLLVMAGMWMARAIA